MTRQSICFAKLHAKEMAPLSLLKQLLQQNPKEAPAFALFAWKLLRILAAGARNRNFPPSRYWHLGQSEARAKCLFVWVG
jgi:hypothetical protein